jgi:fluoroquinolone resistance protein
MDTTQKTEQPELFSSIIRELEAEEKQKTAAPKQKKSGVYGSVQLSLQPEKQADSADAPALPDAENYVENKTFTGIHTDAVSLYDSTYTDCTFNSCSFNKADLTNATFTDCTFINCELIMCKIDGTTIDSVHFKSCRLTGMNFTEVSEYGFSPDFTDSLLDSCVFYDNTLNHDFFINSTLRNTDFTNCRLKNVDFSGSRFQSAAILGCNLEGSDFRSASGYAIDPAANKLKGARFSLPEAASFLKYIGVSVE